MQEASAVSQIEPVNAVNDGVAAWQTKLLPTMRLTLIALACFFFVVSCIQLAYLNRKILDSPSADIRQAVEFPKLEPKTAADNNQALAAMRLKALIILEANATDAQYHQASVLLAGRLWTAYLGFVTGMILALVGATFVLGKLQEQASDISSKTAAMELSLKTTSPGLVLCFLGVALMICTILTHNNIDTVHRAMYLGETFDSSVAGDNTESEGTSKGKTGQGTKMKTPQPPPLVLPNDLKSGAKQ